MQYVHRYGIVSRSILSYESYRCLQGRPALAHDQQLQIRTELKHQLQRKNTKKKRHGEVHCTCYNFRWVCVCVSVCVFVFRSGQFLFFLWSGLCASLVEGKLVGR